MKVLHMLQSDRFSGAENVACQIISICEDEDTEFIYSSQDGQIREALKERSIEFCPIRKISVSEFRRVIREVKPDIIHAHDMGASFFAALACKKIPLISHIHNNNFDSRAVSLKSILYLFAAKKAKHIFWVSNSAFEGYAFHNHFSKKSSVLNNIIDVDKLKEKTQTDKNTYNYDVVFLGRLSFAKNPIRLIDVFEKVAKKRPQTKMAIIGTGELDGEVKAYARQKGLMDNIDFLGFNANPYKILANSKLMIMTSRFEGLPMCAVEAAALGVPIVSTPTDGLKDLIINGVNGYLSEDDEILSEKIIEILNNTDLQKSLSEGQIEFSKKYNDKERYRRIICDEYR